MHTRWRLGDDLMPIDTDPKSDRPGLVTTVALVLFLAAIDAAIRHRAERARSSEESWSDPAMPRLVSLEGKVLSAKTKYRDRDAERRALLEELKQRRDPFPTAGVLWFLAMMILFLVGCALAKNHWDAVNRAAPPNPGHALPAAPAPNPTASASPEVPDLTRDLAKLVAAAFKNDAPDRAPQGGRR